MPRVPEYGLPSQGLNTLPQPSIQAAKESNASAEQLGQLGQQMQRSGQAGVNIADQMQQQANQVRIDDALNQAKETALGLTYGAAQDNPQGLDGYTKVQGKQALDRPNGIPMADEYAQVLGSQISKITDGLGNDAQKAAFQSVAAKMLTSFHGQVMQHENDAFKTYALSTSEGVIKTAQQDIGLNWNNPDAIGAAVKRIRAETYRQGQLLGKSAEWIEAQVRSMESGAHRTAVTQALSQGDLSYAQGYLDKYSKDMDANDLLASRGLLTKQLDGVYGMTAAQNVVGSFKSQVQPTSIDRAFNILVNTESGGKQLNPDGSPVTSSAGAVGAAQVMKDTGPEAAKLAGLPWDENKWRNDESYNKALGLAYFQKQLQDHGGDLAQAYAAYNAGAGRLAVAKKNAELNQKQGGTLTWLDFMPKETQNYVTKNMQAYQAGGGQPQRPTFAEIDAKLQSDPTLANHPERYKIARTEAQRLYTEQTAAIKQQDEYTYAEGIRGLLANGGSYASLPAPLRDSINPQDVPKLMRFAKSLATDGTTTDLWLYNKLADPQYLNSLSDDQFYAMHTALSPTDFKHFANQRTATGATATDKLDSTTIKTEVDNRLRMIGINPSASMTKDAPEAARVGALRQAINTTVLARQQEKGSKLTESEVRSVIDQTFAQTTTVGHWYGDSKQASASLTSASQIPNVDAFKKAWAAKGIPNPTDAQLLYSYWLYQNMQSKK